MKILNLAIFLGLLTLVGCEEPGVDDEIPETMPGQYDPDINDDIDNPNADLDPNGALGVDEDVDIDVDLDTPPDMTTDQVPESDLQMPTQNDTTPGTTTEQDPTEQTPDPAGGEDADVVEEVPPGADPLEGQGQANEGQTSEEESGEGQQP